MVIDVICLLYCLRTCLLVLLTSSFWKRQRKVKAAMVIHSRMRDKYAWAYSDARSPLILRTSQAPGKSVALLKGNSRHGWISVVTSTVPASDVLDRKSPTSSTTVVGSQLQRTERARTAVSPAKQQKLAILETMGKDWAAATHARHEPFLSPAAYRQHRQLGPHCPQCPLL